MTFAPNLQAAEKMSTVTFKQITREKRKTTSPLLSPLAIRYTPQWFHSHTGTHRLTLTAVASYTCFASFCCFSHVNLFSEW